MHKKHPVATKRVVRAILKAADICVSDPERVARLLVDGGYTKQYDYALQALREIPYAKWRDYRPGGHDPVLLAAPARGRHDQVEPAEDHRRWHRLALPQRAQARVEDMSRWLGTHSVAGAACPGPAHAHDAPHDQRLPIIGPAPDFTLTSQDGMRVSLRDFRGKVVAVTSSSRPAPTSARC